MLTPKDISTITRIIDTKLKQNRNQIVDAIFRHLEDNYVTKEDFEDLKDHINNLPTREEFFSRMDKISQDYQTFIQEKAAILSRLDDILTAKTN